MVLRIAAVFVASVLVSVALACGSGPCGPCDSAAQAAKATDLTKVDGESVRLTVAGVRCGGSAASFHAAVTKIDGVTGATVQTDGKAEVKFDPDKTDADKIIAAVAETTAFTATKTTDEA